MTIFISSSDFLCSSCFPPAASIPSTTHPSAIRTQATSTTEGRSVKIAKALVEMSGWEEVRSTLGGGWGGSI